MSLIFCVIVCFFGPAEPGSYVVFKVLSQHFVLVGPCDYVGALLQSSSPVLDAAVGCSAYESGSNRCQVDVRVERAVKNCLSAMWKLRESIIGHLAGGGGWTVGCVPWIYARTCDVISGQVAGAVDDLN